MLNICEQLSSRPPCTAALSQQLMSKLYACERAHAGNELLAVVKQTVCNGSLEQ